MQAALFVVSKLPENEVWKTFSDRIASKVAPSENTLRFSETVWFLNVTQTFADFGCLVREAEDLSISYGILPLEHEPQWLPAGFDPKTIQALVRKKGS